MLCLSTVCRTGGTPRCTLSPRHAGGARCHSAGVRSANCGVPPGTAGAGAGGVDAAGAGRAGQGAAAGLAGVGAAGGAGRAECRHPDSARLGPGGLQPPGRPEPW